MLNILPKHLVPMLFAVMGITLSVAIPPSGFSPGNTLADQPLWISGACVKPFPYYVAGAFAPKESLKFSLQNQIPANLGAIEFSHDGTKFFAVNLSNEIFEYSLSTAFDVSTASYSGDAEKFALTGGETNVNDLLFNNDGTKFYTISSPFSNVYQYSLATAYDISTASYDGINEILNASFVTGSDVIAGVFNPDGSKLYLAGNETKRILTVDLSSPFDVSTGTYAGAGSDFDFTTQTSFVSSLVFNDDGTKVFLGESNHIYSYTLSTAYDVSTATYDGDASRLDFGDNEDRVHSIAFNTDGTKLLTGTSESIVVTYELTSDETTAPTMLSAVKESNTRIKITMDENVGVFGTNYEDFVVTDVLGNTYAVSNAFNTGPGKTEIVLTTANLSTATGNLKVTYVNNNALLSDENCNAMATDATGVEIVLDSTAPTLVSVTINSNTQLTVTFSEPVKTNGTNPGDFSVKDTNNTNYAVTAQADGTAQDTDLVLTVADLSTATGRLAVTYVNNNAEVTDLSGNALATDATGVDVKLNGPPVFTSTPVTSVNEGDDYSYVPVTTDEDNDEVSLSTTSLPAWLNLTTKYKAQVTTYAGSLFVSQTIDGDLSTADFRAPYGIATDANQNIYVAEFFAIRKIDTNGNVTTITNDMSNGGFLDLVVDANGDIYAATGFSGTNQILKITQAGVTTVFAGAAERGYQDGNGTNARFSSPIGIAMDNAGNFYVADGLNYAVRKITPAGEVTTLAGNGTSGDVLGTGSAAQFGQMRDLTIDNQNNIYVVDIDNNKIKKVTPGGVVTLLAGSGSSTDLDGSGSAAGIGLPQGIAFDGADALYVTTSNHKIKRVSLTGDVVNLTGTGSSGFKNGNQDQAKFDSPNLLHALSPTELLIPDTENSQIRKITLQGTSSTLSGDTNGQVGNHDVTLVANDGKGGTVNQQFTITVNPDVAPVFTSSASANFAENSTATAYIATATDNSTITFGLGNTKDEALFNIDGSTGEITFKTAPDFEAPGDADTDNAYELDVTATDARSNAATLAVTINVTNVSDNDPVVTSSPITSLNEGDDYSYTVTATDADNDELTFTANPLPGWLTLSTKVAVNVTTFAGSTSGTADGDLTTAQFFRAVRIVKDANQNLYFNDVASIRKIDPSGNITTITSDKSKGSFSDIAIDSNGNLFATSFGDNKILKITPNGAVSVFAGDNTAGLIDGTGTAARFQNPRSIVIDASDNLYVTDYSNHAIRKITPAGVVTTLVGNGTAGDVNANGTNARINFPYGMTIDTQGNLYFVDQQNFKVKKVSTSGNVSTVAGNGNRTFKDGDLTTGSLASTEGIAFDGNDNLYVTSANRIRRVKLTGEIVTIAGKETPGSQNGNQDEATFDSPVYPFVLSSTELLIPEYDNPLIRKLEIQGTSTVLTGNATGQVGDHDVTLVASDGSGATDSQSFTISVLDVTPPVFTSNASVNFAENSTTTAYTAAATDDSAISFALGTNKDESLFSIDVSTGEITFKAAPDFEAPGDADTDNAYELDVTATDARSNAATLAVTINVTNVSDNDPVITSTAVTTVNEGDDYSYSITTTDADNDDLTVTAPTLPPWLTLSTKIAAQVTTFAGSTQGTADGDLSTATFGLPIGITKDGSGNLFVTDGASIRKIDPSGNVTTITNDISKGNFAGLVLDSNGDLFVTTLGFGDNEFHQILKVTQAGTITVFVGDQANGFQDATGTNARFNSPFGIAIDGSDNLYVADVNNHRIRKISPAGVVTTFVGNGTDGDVNGSGTNAQINTPNGVIIDAAGNLYITDTGNSKIKKVTSAGEVSTIAGNGTAATVNGDLTTGSIATPIGLVYDGNQFLYVTSGNQIVRASLQGDVLLVAGQSSTGNENGNQDEATFNVLAFPLLTSSTELLIPEFGNSLIRKVEIQGETYTLTGNSAGQVGDHDVTLKAADGSGATDSQSFTISVLDVTPPLAPAISAISEDTGTSSSDNITNDQQLIFKGTAEALSQVEVFIQGTSAGTTTTDANGDWSFDYTATTLIDGTYNITAKATDAAGNVGPDSQTLSLTIDTVSPDAPTIGLKAESDSGLSNTDLITKDNTPDIEGTASANGSVTIYAGGQSIGTATADASGKWTFTPSQAFSEGVISIKASETDVAGNVSDDSQTLAVTIDITAPEAPVLSGISTDTGSSADDEITNDNTLSFKGTAEANGTVELFIGGVSIGTTTANANGDFSFDHRNTTLSEGSIAITAATTDAAGNTGVVSNSMAVTIDLTVPDAPVIAGISTDTGMSTEDEVTNDQTLIFNGTAEPNSTVEVLIAGTGIGITTADANGTWAFDHSAVTLPEAAYAITARATDIAGNTSVLSSELSVIVDITAPSVSMPDLVASSDTGISNADNLTNDNTPTFEGVAEANVTIEVFADNQSIGTTTTDNSGNWTFTPGTALNAGTFSITIRSTDVAGNTSPDSGVLSLTIDTTLDSPVLSPADNAIDILPGTNLTMTFAENINKGTGQIIIKKVSDDSVFETIDITSAQVSIASGVATIDPANLLLPPSTEFYLSMNQGAFTDDAGNVYAGINNKSGWTFTMIAASVVSSVVVPTQGTYKIGDNLDFTVEMLLPVTVAGEASIPVTIGSTTVNATQVGTVGNGNSILFRYTVVENDLDTDGIVVGQAMNLNGGTMKDEFGVDAILTLNSVGATNAILVDGVKPAPSLSSGAVALVNSSFSITVTYDEEVENFEAGDLSVTNGTASNLQSVIFGKVWTADITPASDGTVTVALPANTANDLAGNESKAATELTRAFDGTAPTVLRVERKDADPLVTGTTSVNFRVVFSESVSGVDLTDLEVVLTGTATGTLNSITPVDATTYDVNLSGIGGQGTIGLNVKTDGTITDEATNPLAAAFTGEVYTTNYIPRDIGLSATSIDENNELSATVGSLSTVDIDGGSHTYTLVTGAGDTDNPSFVIEGNELKTNMVSFDFETKNSYSIRLKADDGLGGLFEKALTIAVNDVNEVPISLDLSNNTIDEADEAQEVGILTSLDPDAGDAFTFTLQSGTGDDHNDQFEIAGSTLRTAGLINFEDGATRSVLVRVTDSGGLTLDRQFTINIGQVEIEPLREYNTNAPGAEVKNIFSPNGDGVNDTWVIEDILDNPINVVKVFAQGGKLIYSKANYQNDWDATFKGEPIPAGTYYYEINIYNGQKIIKGFLTIIRN